MTKQTFLQGTLMLVIAGMITRFLGFINRLVMARLMGEEGMGLYMMALPSLFVLNTLTQIGLPIAISKRVAEANATHDENKIKSILIVALTLTILTSIIFTASLIYFAPYIANHQLTQNRTIFPLWAVAPIIPLVAITSVLKGYFQGKQNMKPQSYALVIEQTVRIIFVIILVKILLPFGVEYAATGAMVSVIL